MALMEKTENYKSLQYNNEVMSTLEKLSIIIDRNLSALEDEGKLQDFIKDAKEILTDNGGFLYLHTHFQVMVSNECQVPLDLITEKLNNSLKKNSELIIDDSKRMSLNHPKSKQVDLSSFCY